MDSQAIAGQLAAYDAKPVTSTDALNSALTQYGVPEIRNTVSGLRTTLANTQNSYNAVDPSVTGRTQGSLVTEAQREKQVSNEQAPIAANLTSENSDLNTANADLTDKQNQAGQLAQNEVSDYNTGRANLQSEYDTAYKSEQDKAAATLAAQQAAEQQREFNVSAAQKSSGTTASPADIKAAVSQHVGQQLASNVGKDGHVSNETWSAALNDFVSGGGTTRQFFQNYSQYVNPLYKTSYAGWADR